MTRRLLLAPVLVGVVIAGSAVLVAGRPAKFYKDDPLLADPETQDASHVKPWKVNESYDFIQNSFLDAGEHRDVRASNVNTLDEVPDSSWFTNRMGSRVMTADEVETGPVAGTGPEPGMWTIVSGKNEGITPGLTIADARDDVYFVKFDPPSNPEMATGAEVISTQFFHALGYHVPGELYCETPARRSENRRRRDHQGHRRPHTPLRHRGPRIGPGEGRPPRGWHVPCRRQQGAARQTARPVPLPRHPA